MQLLLTLFALAMMVGCAVLFWRIVAPFAEMPVSRLKRLVLFGLFFCTWGMVIWISDPNLLYLMPFFMVIFILCTSGDLVGRTAIATIFFSLAMSTAAITDSFIRRYLPYAEEWDLIVSYCTRLLVLAVIAVLVRQLVKDASIALSRRYWQLVLALSMMPFCALIAVVLLTYDRNYSDAVAEVALRQGLAVLPFVLLTSVVLLVAISVLSKQEALERANSLAREREVYYQSLRQQDKSLRQLRHDLRNHLTALSGLIELGKIDEATAYLAQLTENTGLRAPRRYCSNEVANIVLSTKAAELEQAGIRFDADALLPDHLPFSDIDLCALLGNALDNAREGASGSIDPVVRLRARFEKGLLMLQVENSVAHAVDPALGTTKNDKSQHGFGIPGMRDIAARYGGSLEAGMYQGQFRLTVCLSEKTPSV